VGACLIHHVAEFTTELFSEYFFMSRKEITMAATLDNGSGSDQDVQAAHRFVRLAKRFHEVRR